MKNYHFDLKIFGAQIVLDIGLLNNLDAFFVMIYFAPAYTVYEPTVIWKITVAAIYSSAGMLLLQSVDVKSRILIILTTY